MRQRGVSLTAQIIALVMGSVIAAQAVTILAIVLVPPSPPPRYALTQVADALRGGDISKLHGRGLSRKVVEHLPPAVPQRWPREPFETGPLASLLNVPVDHVRIQFLPPRWLTMVTLGGLLSRPPMHPGGPPGGPPPMFPPGFHPTPPSPASLALQGEFQAAWLRPDGHWVMVQPGADFDWLPRIVVWIVGGFLIMGPIGFWFARRITAPLQGFAESAEALGRDPQAAMMAPTGPAEIGVAARAFNAMQARIHRYVADRVGMIGAISHDLRTPLTRIRFKVDGLDREVKATVLHDVEQMEHMITAVIAFSQEASTPGARQRLDLTSLVASVADSAAEIGGDVQAPLEPAVIVEGDPIALQRLFANLIDNALKYGKRAEVMVSADNGEATVAVADSGPGLPPVELERVFTPFYRAREAQLGGSSGVGLGLSIARSAARAHGGDVRLVSSAKGLTALVTLPLAREA